MLGSLARPGLLLLLWGLPLLVLLRYWADRQRDRARQGLLGEVMGLRLGPPVDRGLRWLRTGLLTAAAGLLIWALAQPQGGVFYESVEGKGVDVFVLLDVSRSMLAEDVRPSRLERARSDIRDFLAHARGDRVGLITFAGKAVVKCPLTLDYDFFDLMLTDADTSSAPRGGTLIGDAVRKALASFTSEEGRERLLLLVTDGDDQESFPLEAARLAAEQGVSLFAVGLGDAGEGTAIPAADRTGYMTYQGEIVRSRLGDETLRQMALATGGAYLAAGTKAHDVGAFYDEYVAPIVGKATEGGKRKRQKERYQWYAAVALVLLLAETWLEPYRGGRAREAAA